MRWRALVELRCQGPARRVYAGSLRGIAPEAVSRCIGLAAPCSSTTPTTEAGPDLVSFPHAPARREGQVRSGRFYCDGIRRIQATVQDPLLSLEMAFYDGDQPQQELAQQTLDPGRRRAARGGPDRRRGRAHTPG